MKHILYIALCLISASLYAQDFSPLAFDYKLYGGNSGIRKNGEVQLAFPVFISGKNQIVVSPQYKFLGLDDSFPFDKTNFYQFSVRMAWRHQLNDRWNAALLVSPSLASASGDFSSEAWMWSGGVRVSNRVSQRFLYYFGIAYSNRFSNNLLVPLAGLRWNPVSRMNLSLNLPSRARLSWDFSDRIHTGLQFAGNRQTSYIPNQSEYDYFWFKERNLSWFTDLKLVRNWWVSADLGYSLKRDLLAYQESDHPVWRLGTQFDRTSFDPVFEYSGKGFFLNVSVGYRLGKRGKSN